MTRRPRGGGKYRATTLVNGVRVLTERMRGVRSVAVGAWVRQGSALESADAMGASHLLEHMIFRGTANRSRREIALALESVGGSLNAYTSREHTGYEARILADHLPLAAEVLSDLVRNPLLAQADMDHEKEVVGEEIAAVEDTPDDLVFDLHGDRMWGGHSYGQPILGTRATVGALTRDQLAELHRTAYVGANLVVAAAGCVEHGDFTETAREWFGDMERGRESPLVAGPGEVRPGMDRVPRDCAQAHIVLGRDTVGHAHEDRYTLILLSAALGGGMSSRLFQRIREELALAYSVYAYQTFYARAGMLGIYVGTRPACVPAALDAVRAVCRDVATRGLPPDELARIKEQVKGQLLLSLESPGARLHRLAGFALHGEPVAGLDEVRGMIDAVSECDIVRVAGDVLDPERLYTLCLGPDEPNGMETC